MSDRLKILGVMLYSSLSFDDHVNAVVRACNYHLRSLRYIRHSVIRDIANILACSIAGARIDYCNALLYGLSGKNIDRLQRLQNGLARVVCDIGVQKLRDSGLNSTALLKELHWLPIRTRIEFKVLTLVTKHIVSVHQATLHRVCNRNFHLGCCVSPTRIN